MKILLINPRLKTWSPNIYPPLGLCYIASALESRGYNLHILDLNSHRISDNNIRKYIMGVDIIGITGMITEYHEVVRLVNLCNSVNPHAKIVLGGALATTHTDDLLLKSKADYVVIGEGEATTPELFEAIASQYKISKVDGIAYKDNGSIVKTRPRQPIKSLDDILLPARHLIDMKRYTTHHLKTFGIKMPEVKSTTMITSRGCPYNCTFCFKDIWGYRWRGRSPQNIVDEVKYLKQKYGFNGIVFNDDTFVCNPKRVVEFCRILIDSRLDVKWYCNGRVNLMNKKMLDMMAKAGCVAVAYGIESGNQTILDSIKKSITIEQVKNAVSWTKKAGIHVSGYFMLGILGDSKETMKQTIDFAQYLDLDFYGFTITSPIIGTTMYQSAIEAGFTPIRALDDFSLHATINMTKDCTKGDLEKLNTRVFKDFTLRKRYGKKYLLNPLLWFDGLKSFLFVLGKRSPTELLKKVLIALK